MCVCSCSWDPGTHGGCVIARTTIFSHSQTVVTCSGCTGVLCTPTGGKAKLSEGEKLHAL